MAYTPTEWKDHIVQHPNRFRVIDNGDGTVDILDEHGEILQQGTPVDASRLNKMEKGIKEAHDLIDAHLNDTVYDGVHGLMLSQDMTLYVDAENGDDSNPGTQQEPLKTINAAIQKIKFVFVDVERFVTIQLMPGLYQEDVIISNLHGPGIFTLRGSDSLSDVDDYVIDGYISIKGCSTIYVQLQGIKVLGNVNNQSVIDVSRSLAVIIERCKIDRDGKTPITTNNYGVYVSALSHARIVESDISNISGAPGINAAIQCFEAGAVSSINNTGSNNSIGLRATSSIIHKYGTQPSGWTSESAPNGGLIVGQGASLIEDMGTNANGTYVRWSNGLQICWAGRSVINWPAQTTANQGSYYASDFTWTFPASFIDTNIIITASPGFVGSGSAWGVTTIYHDPATTTSVRLRLWTTHSRPDISNGTTVAIGRWK